MPPAPSSARALQAILPQIAENKPYEAHQKARTFVARYVKSGQHDVAIDVLFQSARELLKAGHTGSGVDLGSFLIEVYDTATYEHGLIGQVKGRMTQLIALTGPDGAWRKTLIDKTVLRWSVKHGKYPAGDPELHHYCGELLYREGAFEAAEQHLLNSASRDSARLLAQMMFEWSRDGTNPGPFLPSYLLNTSILAARTFLTTFIGLLLSSPQRATIINQHFPDPIILKSPDSDRLDPDEVQITTDPTLNFLQLAIQTCQRAGWGPEATTSDEERHNRVSREAWLRLASRYRSRIVGGDVMRNIIDSLGDIYFDIPAPRKGGNPLQDMMSSFFGGGPAPDAGTKRKPRRALTAGTLD
ncbi:cytoplasmic protein [Rhizoctonia solani AG-1 IA]|uniref:Cytoplasmic protein n=1 Tax=Thanatephorus cucumeris (strain AG1-IA) TaxID=983506 RepID=L8WUB8_THACA|nr:cytoplasmic protein [Rhizoctonia solani AG-1 IA]